MTSIKTTRWLQDQLKTHFENESTGHDYWHALRVYKSAYHLAKIENADMNIVTGAALLHDVVDSKLDDSKRAEGYKKIDDWLTALDYSDDEKEKVLYIIDHMSYKGGTNKHIKLSLEGQVVQDADRLDALGAIGIARTFAFGGAKGRDMHNPDEAPKEFDDYEAFKKYKDTSVNHFYEKLLKLKALMNTTAGKEMAEARHDYMESFLEQFYGEWSGDR
jgi:uncharacterized protein